MARPMTSWKALEDVIAGEVVLSGVGSKARPPAARAYFCPAGPWPAKLEPTDW